MIQGSNPGRGKRFVSKTSRPAVGPTQPPMQCLPEPLSLVVQRPGRDADHTLPYLHSPICLQGQFRPVSFYRSNYCHCGDDGTAKPSTNPVTDISRGTSCGNNQEGEMFLVQRYHESFQVVRRKPFLPKTV